MKSLWSGSLTLSLLNLPVKLGTAADKNDLKLHLVRASDGKQIKFLRVAEGETEEVPWNETGKGYDAPDGSLVVLKDTDFDKAYGSKNRMAEVVCFTDPSTIPPMAVKSCYWVQAGPGGDKTYALLAAALQRTGKVAVVSFAMRQRVSMAVLRSYDGYLALEALEWDADLVRPDFKAPACTATEAEEQLADTLIEQMTQKYDHAAQEDPSAKALLAVIEEKINAGHVLAAPARPEGRGKPQDLTSALEASVAAQKPAPAPRKPRTRKAVAA